MKFSNKEIKDLFIAWFMISIAFAILFSGGLDSFLNPVFLLISFGISALTVGIGFLFHELMHKLIAQKYHLWAEFRASYNMLWLAIAFSFFGFIIAAPGAVLIKGPLSRERNGKISLAGPLTNIVLAILFLLLIVLFSKEGLIGLFFNYGLTINSLLAAFNLLPFGFFDGKKVYVWNKTAYFISLILSISLLIFGFKL